MSTIPLAVLRAGAAAVLIAIAVAACAPSILTPPSGPGTEYPCGLNRHSCGDGTCCSDESTCCDGRTCTAGSCEFLGVDENRAPDAGVTRVIVPAYRPVRP